MIVQRITNYKETGETQGGENCCQPAFGHLTKEEEKYRSTKKNR